MSVSGTKKKNNYVKSRNENSALQLLIFYEYILNYYQVCVRCLNNNAQQS